MNEEFIDILKKKHLTVATAESCTGGMIASEIVGVSGASSVFNEGYVTYSENAKNRLLGVSMETIKKYNVVSTQVAYEMAKGAAKAANSNMAISTTGVAGPDGGTEDIPVGTVCIGIYFNGNIITKKFIFDGDRMQVRTAATAKAIEMAKKIIETA